MGEVWKAWDTRLDRMVAVKRLKGRRGEAVQQIEFALREDPLSVHLGFNRGSCLAAAGCDEDAAQAFRDW